MSVRSVYNVYANFYDFLFSKTFDDARKKAISSMEISEEKKIIEFGIGTGLSLKYFPKKFKGLTGIDLSEKMLEKCALKAKRYQMDVDLKIMDCENTPFEDESFDHVVLMFIYSVSSNPHKLLQEALRICKNSGSVLIINHFSNVNSEKLNFFEYLLSYFENIVGFRSKFSFKEYIVDKNIVINSMVGANIFSMTKVIDLKKAANTHLLD